MISLPELSRRRRLIVLVICCSSLFIVGLDSTIVNVALPSIGRDLHASVAGLQWTIDGYALVLASFLMLSGATGDRIGRRRVFLVGLAIFTAGSGLCSLAPALGWLIAFRMLQAIGGSMLNPVAMSIITNTFTDKTERARAIGVWGGAYGLSMALGPVVGGLLVDSVGWRGTFWVNIPVGLVAIALTARLVPESRAPRPRRPDPVGQGLIIVMLGSLTYAIIEGPGLGWHAPVIMALFAVAAVALAVFVAYEARRVEPVLDPRFFRSAPFAGLGADRDQRHRRRRRLPLPGHAVPAGRARHVGAAGGPAHAADGHHDGARRCGVQPDTGPPRRAAAHARGRRGLWPSAALLLSRLTASTGPGAARSSRSSSSASAPAW